MEPEKLGMLPRRATGSVSGRQVAPLLAELGGPVRIGPPALALAAWLRLELGQSIGRLSRLFTVGIGLKWPTGSISTRPTKLTERMAPVVDRLWDELREENLPHVDETDWREDGARAMSGPLAPSSPVHAIGTAMSSWCRSATQAS